MLVRNRLGSLLEIEFPPLGERELTTALQGEQTYPKHVGQSLKTASIIQVLEEGFQLLLREYPRSGFLPPPGR
jgi:hypothetical protein